MTPAQIEFYKRLAHGLALQFGPNCEIVVHDLEADDLDHSIVAIENGHISGRRLGDGPSHVVLEALNDDADKLHDRPPYLTKTEDGKLLKSSTIFIRDDTGWPCGILAINFDITLMTAFSNTLGSLIGTDGSATEPEPITKNIGDLLDDLFRECEQVVGKPAARLGRFARCGRLGSGFFSLNRFSFRHGSVTFGRGGAFGAGSVRSGAGMD